MSGLSGAVGTKGRRRNRKWRGDGCLPETPLSKPASLLQVHVFRQEQCELGQSSVRAGSRRYRLLWARVVTSEKPLCHFGASVSLSGASLVGQMVKSPPTMKETRVRSLGQEDPLEKEMATHSSILAWRIPWTEEPGGLQSRGSHSWTRLSDWTHCIRKMTGWTHWFINSLQLCLGRIATILHAPPPTSHPTVVSGLFANRIQGGSVGGARDLWIGLLGLLVHLIHLPHWQSWECCPGRLYCCWAWQLLSELTRLWATKGQHLKEKHFFAVPSPRRAQHSGTSLVLGAQFHLASLTGVRPPLSLMLGRCSCSDKSARDPGRA